jgi:hypothetical protein
MFSTMLPVEQRAIAAPGDCNPSNFTYHDTAGPKKLRVNTANVSSFGYSGLEATSGAALGAAAWNEQANAGHFTLSGTSNLENIPEDLADCTNDGVDYSLIVFDDTTCSNIAAQCQPRCEDGAGVYHHARIVLFLKTSGCGNRSWGNGATTANQREYPGVLVHELGHLLGLGDVENAPDDGEDAVMRGDTVATGLFRDLYEWDLKCSAELSGKRALSGYKRTHSSSGFGSASLFTGTEDICKASSGLAFDGGTAKWASAYHRSSSIAWDGSADGSFTSLSNPSANNGAGIRSSIWREDDTVDRVHYSFWDDYPTDYDYGSTHIVRQIRSTNEFSTQTAEDLRYCTAMTGFLTCTAKAYVQSDGPVATAYVGGSIERSVFAWLNQDHTATGANAKANEIFIAVGYAAHDTLSIPTETGIRSAVPPGLACNENFSGSYDCVLVYVPIDDLTLPIRTTRFSIAQSANNYTITLDGSGPYSPTGSVRTAESIAVWYLSSTSEFYAAWRSANSGQHIVVQSTSNGMSWSVVDSSLDTAATGPSAASTWRGSSNLLVYPK